MNLPGGITTMNGPAPKAPEAPPVIELTGFEILTLLSLSTENEGAKGTRKAFHLPDIPDDSPLLAAGLSSLVVRKLVAHVDGKFVPQGEMLSLAAIFNQATEWIEASGGSGDKTHAALLIKGPSGATLVEPQPHGIWRAIPLPAEKDLKELAAGYVKAAFTDITGRPFVATMRVIDAEGTIVKVFDDVNPNGHAAEILKVVASLDGAR
jgi:hypothetical protein